MITHVMVSVLGNIDSRKTMIMVVGVLKCAEGLSCGPKWILLVDGSY